MTTQINLRVTKQFLAEAKAFADKHGFLNVQEFFREAAREKLYGIRPEYVEKLQTNDASAFSSEKKSQDFIKKLRKQTL